MAKKSTSLTAAVSSQLKANFDLDKFKEKKSLNSQVKFKEQRDLLIWLLRKSLKLSTRQTLASLCTKSSEHTIVIPKTAGYYIAAYPSEFDRSKQMTINFKSEFEKDLAFIIINSNIFFWHWRVYGDGFDVTSGDITSFPLLNINKGKVKNCADKLMSALDECTVYKKYRGLAVPNINFNKRMDIILEIDELKGF